MRELDRFALEDMLHYARLATRLLGTADATALAGDERTLLAVLHAVQIVGEAANRVSDEIRSLLPDIPWHKVVGMRHHLVHGYRETRLGVIVQTIRDDLPALIAALDRALKDETP